MVCDLSKHCPCAFMSSVKAYLLVSNGRIKQGVIWTPASSLGSYDAMSYHLMKMEYLSRIHNTSAGPVFFHTVLSSVWKTVKDHDMM